jgi:hypothetical protein
MHGTMNIKLLYYDAFAFQTFKTFLWRSLILEIYIPWVLMPCILVYTYVRFRGAWCLLFQTDQVFCDLTAWTLVPPVAVIVLGVQRSRARARARVCVCARAYIECCMKLHYIIRTIRGLLSPPRYKISNSVTTSAWTQLTKQETVVMHRLLVWMSTHTHFNKHIKSQGIQHGSHTTGIDCCW